MGLFRFVYETILRREYPLIDIQVFYRKPCFERCPDCIHLSIRSWILRAYEPNPDLHAELFINILEHEYLHAVIDRFIGTETCRALDKIHCYSRDINQLTFRNNRTGNYLAYHLSREDEWWALKDAKEKGKPEGQGKDKKGPW